MTPVAGTPARPKYRHGETTAKPNLEMSLADWLAAAPDLDSDWDPLAHVYRRSLVDLAALRFYPDESMPTASVPAAGLPWFMALFGRDSVITSYQTLHVVPELARTTLRVLAALQGRQNDRFREEEPGKILHELRLGELTAFGERPHSPYFGTYDATPLYLVLLDEYERWTGDAGWKDSWNSIVYRAGTLSSLPRATCEIQGYAYDAKVRAARLARDVWKDLALAERLEREAAELKRRFNRDFWLPDREFFALALDGEKRPVDSVTRQLVHCRRSRPVRVPGGGRAGREGRARRRD